MDKQTELIAALCNCSAKSRKIEAAYYPDKLGSILRLSVLVVQDKQGTAGTGPEVSTVLLNKP